MNTPIIFLIVMNLIGFLAMAMDKQAARKGGSRIPEKVLFLLSAVGGSFGCYIGMHLCHHKTQHWYFRIGFPLICILHLLLMVYFAYSGAAVLKL